MYAKIVNGIVIDCPYSIFKLKRDNPNVSFPRVITKKITAKFDVINVIEITPSINKYQVLVKSYIPEIIDGKWTVTHTVSEMDINKAKTIAYEKLKDLRNKAINAPINNVQVEKYEDRENVNGAIEYFTDISQGTGFITWTMNDNTEQNVTLNNLTTLKRNYVLRKATIFKTYQKKKALVETSITVAEILAIFA